MKNVFFKNLQIVNDVYFTAEKIKQIDKNYQLFYNYIDKRYEVHNLSYYPSLCVTFYKYPDNRLYEKLLKTNSKTVERLIKEIDEENNYLLNKQEDFYVDKANQELKEVFKYSQSKTDFNLTTEQIKNIINKWGRLWQKKF